MSYDDDTRRRLLDYPISNFPPHRVVIYSPAQWVGKSKKHIFDRAEAWLIERFGNHDLQGNPSPWLRFDNPAWSCFVHGQYMIFGFNDDTDAAMFRILFDQNSDYG